MKKLVFVLLMCLFITTSAASEMDDRWVFIGENVEANEYYFDIRTINRPNSGNNKVFEVFIRTTYSDAGRKTMQDIDSRLTDLSHSIYRWSFDGDKRVFRFLSSAYYNHAGIVIHSSNSAGESDAILPDSTAEAIYDAVHSWLTANSK